jgi:dTDP-3-amino-3,4,6-trideoxy-alpha-D-glucose transaminase
VGFLDLARQTSALRPELDAALERVLRRGRFVLGEEVAAFESSFAAWIGVEHAVGVASGTDAIAVALRAAGVEPGDEVVTAANTCVPTVVGIEAAGAVAVLADVEEETQTLSADALDAALTQRTRAVVPVHLYGQAANMPAIGEIAAAAGLLVIEDCAQAHGAEWAGRRAGTFGHAAAFSFYPTKTLGALGDAGAVVTNDPAVAERARLLRNYGERDRFEHVLRGANSRLDEIQAALLSAKLPHVEGWNERRRAIAAHYDAALAGGNALAPAEAQQAQHVYHLYVVRTPRRDRFRGALAEAGVETAVHYPRPIHRQPAYAALAPPERRVATVDALASEIVSLPLYPELTDEEVAYVGESVARAARA